MQREYCCSKCGLIWFDEKKFKDLVCPECGNDSHNWERIIYACDTFGWAYSHDGVKKKLYEEGKKFHYHQEHPWHGEEE